MDAATSVRSIQWSEDEKTLQTESAAYIVTHWDVTEPASNDIERKDSEAADDDVWAKWEAVVGWPVQGIHDACKSGASVCSVDCRTDLTGIGGAVRVLRGDKDAVSLTIVGDTDGTVRLMRFPALTGAKGYVLKGHGSQVSCVRFTADGARVLVADSTDLAVFQ